MLDAGEKVEGCGGFGGFVRGEEEVAELEADGTCQGARGGEPRLGFFPVDLNLPKAVGSGGAEAFLTLGVGFELDGLDIRAGNAHCGQSGSGRIGGGCGVE